MTRLEQKMFEIFRKIGMSEKDIQGNYEFLCNLYSQKYRKYHNLDHIEDCLEKLERFKHLSENEDAVALALIYHDADYFPLSDENEENSCKLLLSVTYNFLEKNQDLLINAQRCILATSHLSERYLGKELTADEKLTIDIDLSILGDSIRYVKYFFNIREEYESVDTQTFAKARLRVLNKFQEANNQEKLFNFKELNDLFAKEASLNFQFEIDHWNDILKQS